MTSQVEPSRMYCNPTRVDHSPCQLSLILTWLQGYPTEAMALQHKLNTHTCLRLRGGGGESKERWMDCRPSCYFVWVQQINKWEPWNGPFLPSAFQISWKSLAVHLTSFTKILSNAVQPSPNDPLCSQHYGIWGRMKLISCPQELYDLLKWMGISVWKCSA